MRSKIERLKRDFSSLKRKIERNTKNMKLSLENELEIFCSLDKIEKLLEKLDKYEKMCYNIPI